MLPLRQQMLGMILGALLAVNKVRADCECGYSVNSTDSPEHAVFTEILESDFTILKNITEDQDWIVQEWKVSREASHGPYGRSMEPANVRSNPLNNDTGVSTDEAGLELWARATMEDDEHISVSEVDSFRSDMLYGSFRAGIQTTAVNGTCTAFFWYLNDTQEIDMEFLSSQVKDTTAPVNLVLHSILSLDKGNDASDTPTYKVVSLPFNPTKEIHEYRFDWTPGAVSFYADGEFLVRMEDDEYVPSVAGKIVLSHWSNGNPMWSGGPPEEDAKMRVQYVKAYFNSSEPTRHQHHRQRCADADPATSICQIPDQKGPPGDDVYFFYKDEAAPKVENQTIWGVEESKSSAVSTRSAAWSMFFTATALAVVVNCWRL